MEIAIRFILIFAAVLVITVLENNASRAKTKMLYQLLYSGNTEEFRKEMNKLSSKLFVRAFDKDYLCMSAALIENDGGKIEECINNFDHVNLNDQQKRLVYSNAYSYYIGKKDSVNSKKYLDLLTPLLQGYAKKRVEIMYDVYILGGSKYLADCLELLKTAEGERKIELLTLVGLMYKNEGRKEEADNFFNQAKNEHTLLI